MSDNAAFVPTFNINTAVRNFMKVAGCTTKGFNAEQACLYTGLQLEEMAEKITAIAGGCITPSTRQDLLDLALGLNVHADAFKKKRHVGDIMRAERAAVLDADIDLAWVALGGVWSTADNANGAIQEVTRANLDKFPAGVPVRDVNGKVIKPAGWRGPDLSPFVSQPEA